MSVIGPRPGLWNQDILTAERDKYNANDVKPGLDRRCKGSAVGKRCNVWSGLYFPCGSIEAGSVL